LVFSTLADNDLGVANVGRKGSPGSFDGGIAQIQFPQVTPDKDGNHGSGNRGHSAIITMYETCWFTSTSVSFEAAGGILMETGEATASDVHDFASVYGEFLATGNDPTIGQLGSIRFLGKTIAQVGSGITGGNAQSPFVNPTP